MTSVDSHKEHANYVYKVVRSLYDKFCERQLLLKNCPGMIRKLCKLRNLAEIYPQTRVFGIRRCKIGKKLYAKLKKYVFRVRFAVSWVPVR